MTNQPALYDVWWTETGDGGEQRMEDNHGRHWRKILDCITENDLHEKHILDFGCNQGGFLRFLYQERPFACGIGVDLARHSIAIANQRKGSLPLDYVATATLDAYPARFDLAFSSAVIYLIPDLSDHAHQIRHALKPGGVYYATYTDYQGNPSLPKMETEINRFGAIKMQMHSLDDIALAFQEAGFSVGLRRLPTTGFVPIEVPERFYQRVADRMQYEYEQAYIFRFIVPDIG
jgi:SAM-dependent methyltransferase